MSSARITDTNATHRSDNSQNFQKAIIIYKADSYLGYCQILYEYFSNKKIPVQLIEIKLDHGPNVLTTSKRLQWGITFPQNLISSLKWSDVVTFLEGNDADFVFLGLPGVDVFKLCNQLHYNASYGKRVTLVTGFPGLQFRQIGSGLISRSYVDKLLFIDPTFHKYASKLFRILPLVRADCILLGSPRLRSMPDRCTSIENGRVIFFEQNVVPLRLAERKELARELAKIAAALPTRKILIISRNRASESSNHASVHNLTLEYLLRNFDSPNIEMFHGNWTQIAHEVEAALSVSSTALLEASLLKIPSFSIRLSRDTDSAFGAERFFRRLGFERDSDQIIDYIINRRATATVSAASKHLCLFNDKSLSEVFCVPTQKPTSGKFFLLICRQVQFFLARAFDRVMLHFR